MKYTNYDRFAELAKVKNLSSYKISKDTGVSQATLSYWKNGHVDPKYPTLVLLADYMGVSVNEFYKDIRGNDVDENVNV